MFAGMSLAAGLLLSPHVDAAVGSTSPASGEDARVPADGASGSAPQPPPPAHWSLESIAWDPGAMRAEAATQTTAELLTRSTPPLLPVPLPPALDASEVAVAPSGVGRAGARPARRGDREASAAVCRAVDCGAPLRLSGSSARARLCGEHLHAPGFVLERGGPLLRWCQKCNRPHELGVFTGEQRTCAAALAVAAARRRARTASHAVAARTATSAATAGGEDSAGSAPPRQSAPAARRSTPASPGGLGDIWPEPDEFDAALARAFGGHFGSQRPAPRAMSSAGGPACGDELSAFASLLFTPDAAPPPPPPPPLHAAWPASAAMALAGLPPVPQAAPLAQVGPPAAALAAYGYAPAALDALAAFGYAPRAPHAADAGGWWLLPARAHVKLPGGAAVAPPGLPGGLAPAAAAALFMAPPMALHAAVAPGCTLLTLEALVPPQHASADGCGSAPAAAALQALLGALGEVGAYFRGREAVHVAAGGRVATARGGRLVADAPEPAPRALPRLDALAARCDAPAAARPRLVPGETGAASVLPPAAELRCRVHGRFLRLKDGDGGVALAAAGEEGVALLELAPPTPPTAEGAGFAPPGAPRPLLLTRHDAIIAELNASHQHATAAADDAAADGLEADATLLGHALRPDASRSLLAAAAAAAMRRGWPAAAARCCAALAQDAEEDDDDIGGDWTTPPATVAELGRWHCADGAAHAVADDVAAPRRLLHEAVAAGCARSVDVALAAGGPARRCGAACAAAGWPGGATPLHLAAALAARGTPAAATAACAAARALTCGCDAAAADAVVAWLWARDDAGRTPASMVAAAGAAAPPALRALDAKLRAAVDDARPAAQLAVSRARTAHAHLAWPHVALAAAAALEAAASPDDDEALYGNTTAADPRLMRRAAIGAAVLRSAAADWRRAHEPADAATAPAIAAGNGKKSSAAGGHAGNNDVARAAREASWRLQQYAPGLELMAAFQSAYHVAQWHRCAPASVPLADLGAHAIAQMAHPAPGAPPGVFFVPTFEDLGPLFPFCFRTNLWFQAPLTLLMVALLAGGRRGRAMLARHLQPLLALQFAAHALACMLAQTWAFYEVAMAPAGVQVLHLPARCAAYAAAFTLLCVVCWPMRPAVALPLLAARAACPSLVVANAARFGAIWPPMGGATGASLQVGAAAAAAVYCVLRERRLRVEFELH